MHSYLAKLISIAHPHAFPTGSVYEGLDEIAAQSPDLAQFLLASNGLFAFECALQVFPLVSVNGVPSILQWNTPTLWRYLYSSDANGYLFFAEDIFGEQFALREGKVWRFNPETGEGTVFADSFEEWGEKILAAYPVETGYPIAHNWQEQHGPLPLTHRLIPTIPFVAGGKYNVQNLTAIHRLEAMQLRSRLAHLLRNIADGSILQWHGYAALQAPSAPPADGRV